eukprot:1996790-Rhodomonas_salina.1
MEESPNRALLLLAKIPEPEVVGMEGLGAGEEGCVGHAFGHVLGTRPYEGREGGREGGRLHLEGNEEGVLEGHLVTERHVTHVSTRYAQRKRSGIPHASTPL